MARKAPNKGRRNDADAAGAWLGGNRGTVQSSGAGTSDRYGSGFFSVPKNPIDAAKEIGRGFMDQVDYYNRAYVNPVINVAGAVVNKVGGKSDRFKPLPQLSDKEIAIESAVIVAGPLVGKAAGVAGRAVTNVRTKVNPLYETVRAARSNPSGFVRGEATAEDLMKLRSTDRFRYEERVVVPPKMKDDAQHLANIRKQNKSTYHYEDMHRYSEEDMSRFSTFQEDIANRGIQSPVTIGRIKGKPTLLEGNHRVIAQFDIDPKAKVPIQISKSTWDTINRTTNYVDRRAAVKNVRNKIKNKVPKKK